MTTDNKMIWSELRSDYVLDVTAKYGLRHIDGFTTDDDNEEGKVIALICELSNRVLFVDERAATNRYVLDEIHEYLVEDQWGIAKSYNDMIMFLIIYENITDKLLYAERQIKAFEDASPKYINSVIESSLESVYVNGVVRNELDKIINAGWTIAHAKENGGEVLLKKATLLENHLSTTVEEADTSTPLKKLLAEYTDKANKIVVDTINKALKEVEEHKYITISQ
jgi:hypothetical protein